MAGINTFVDVVVTLQPKQAARLERAAGFPLLAGIRAVVLRVPVQVINLPA